LSLEISKLFHKKAYSLHFCIYHYQWTISFCRNFFSNYNQMGKIMKKANYSQTLANCKLHIKSANRFAEKLGVGNPKWFGNVAKRL